MGRQHILDFGQGFFTEIRSFQQFHLGALHQVTNIKNALCLEAVCRSHREFKIVDWTQQDRVNLGFFLFEFNFFPRFEINEY